jgi:DNA (cytosine-5)-methyltransferase 1
VKKVLYNHQASKLSEKDMLMVESVPAGGNWKNIPESIPSERLKQIRKTGGRTTYYGRLRYGMPSYTISTYFNRPGNGCHMHPDDGSNGVKAQHRLITFREAARLQSFPDNFRFYGTKTSMLKQIGNAVPPLLAKAVASCTKELTFVDLFSGAGGMSTGFCMDGKELVGAIEYDKNICETFRLNHDMGNHILVEGDITQKATKEELLSRVRYNLNGRKLGIVVGGPPCQGFSLAGNRFIDDPRNTLFREFVDIVASLKPKVFIMENVPGLLSMKSGAVISEIKKCFEKLDYIVSSPKILKAEDYGVPQRRRRLFLVGHLNNISIEFPPKQLLSLNENLIYPKAITVQEAISDLPPIYSGLGKDEWYIENWAPKSEYQRFMSGLVSFDDFYKKIKANRQRVSQACVRIDTNSIKAEFAHK